MQIETCQICVDYDRGDQGSYRAIVLNRGDGTTHRFDAGHPVVDFRSAVALADQSGAKILYDKTFREFLAEDARRYALILETAAPFLPALELNATWSIGVDYEAGYPTTYRGLLLYTGTATHRFVSPDPVSDFRAAMLHVKTFSPQKLLMRSSVDQFLQDGALYRLEFDPELKTDMLVAV